jgi:putative acetyltransferase
MSDQNRDRGAAGLVLRPARDADGEGMIQVLAVVFAEYPGCLLDRSELPELVAPATSFSAMNGAIWVVEGEDPEGRDGVVGLVAAAPATEPGLFELKKLYLLPGVRGKGLARRLVDRVEDLARSRGAGRVHLWSDTRFVTAHRVYERLGYERLPGTRELHDVSDSVEFHYEKRLGAPPRG